MKVKILRLPGQNLIDADIVTAKATKLSLPAITDGWRFNFRKHAQIKNFEPMCLLQKTHLI
jgi:hypothetical protein